MKKVIARNNRRPVMASSMTRRRKIMAFNMDDFVVYYNGNEIYRGFGESIYWSLLPVFQKDDAACNAVSEYLSYSIDSWDASSQHSPEEIAEMFGELIGFEWDEYDPGNIGFGDLISWSGGKIEYFPANELVQSSSKVQSRPVMASGYEDRPYGELAGAMCDAIRKMARNESTLDNFESYLSRHFDTWLSMYCHSQEGIVDEFERFADIV